MESLFWFLSTIFVICLVVYIILFDKKLSIVDRKIEALYKFFGVTFHGKGTFFPSEDRVDAWLHKDVPYNIMNIQINSKVGLGIAENVAKRLSEHIFRDVRCSKCNCSIHENEAEKTIAYVYKQKIGDYDYHGIKYPVYRDINRYKYYCKRCFLERHVSKKKKKTS